MRALIVLLITIGSVPLILMRPHLGVLMWEWISFMNPHRLTWGAAASFPVADVIAAATLVGWAVSREPKRIPFHPIILLLGLYAAWVTLTTVFAVSPDFAWPKWEITIKIFLFTLVTIGLITTKVRLLALIWVTVISLGFYAVKGGFFTIITGGQHHVFGPMQSFIHDNNALALALIMTLPLVRFLHQQAVTKTMKWLLGASMALWVFSIFGSQSRGAFLGMGAMLIYLLINSRRRALAVLVIILSVGTGVAFMPDKWQGRIQSITEYETDRSAQGRLTMWRFAIDVASDNPVMGGGFNSFYDSGLREKYLFADEKGKAAHSIYFEVLGEHGWVGFLLFMTLAFTTFFTGGRIVKLVKGRPDLTWAHDLATMLQVGLVGYAVAGTFLNLATFDLYYAYMAIMVILRIQVADLVHEKSSKAWSPFTGSTTVEASMNRSRSGVRGHEPN
ncbi:MAG: putative O-glycosylation ligase, exosortase A system-associated [Sphingomonadales bacterium]